MKCRDLRKVFCAIMACLVLIAMTPGNSLATVNIDGDENGIAQGGITQEGIAQEGVAQEGVVKLQLTDADGMPYAKISAWLIAPDGESFISMEESDENGGVVFSGLIANENYLLRVSTKDINNGFIDWTDWNSSIDESSEESAKEEGTEEDTEGTEDKDEDTDGTDEGTEDTDEGVDDTDEDVDGTDEGIDGTDEGTEGTDEDTDDTDKDTEGAKSGTEEIEGSGTPLGAPFGGIAKLLKLPFQGINERLHTNIWVLMIAPGGESFVSIAERDENGGVIFSGLIGYENYLMRASISDINNGFIYWTGWKTSTEEPLTEETEETKEQKEAKEKKKIEEVKEKKETEEIEGNEIPLGTPLDDISELLSLPYYEKSVSAEIVPEVIPEIDTKIISDIGNPYKVDSFEGLQFAIEHTEANDTLYLSILEDITFAYPIEFTDSIALNVSADSMKYLYSAGGRHFTSVSSDIDVNISMNGNIVLDGNGTGGGLSFGNEGTSGLNLVLSGGTIQNCYATEGAGLYVYAEASSVDIYGVTMQNCSAQTYGGGIYARVTGTNVEISNASFINCQSNLGDAVYSKAFKNSSIRVADTTMVNCLGESGMFIQPFTGSRTEMSNTTIVK